MNAPSLRRLPAVLGTLAVLGLLVGVGLLAPPFTEASSHREAPLILDDPIADNTDVYAYRDPNSPDDVILVANYIPLELPSGGPNYHQFGENLRYEIHVKNQTSVGPLGSATDDITYRFTFDVTNEDPTTFFKIRLGQENLRARYTMEKSTDGGSSFQTVVTDGYVPPVNVGPRAIRDGTVGLGTSYEALTQQAITSASTGETVFVGPRDDPFFVDLGGVFDVGGLRDAYGPDPQNENNARDEVAGFNTHAIVLRVPIASLQKDGLGPDQADDILDPDFVIGVWASASRPQIKTLSPTGDEPTYSGPWVQVSRLGMPLTNEVIIPIGEKDRWNATTPYDAAEQDFVQYFVNPELSLYMGNGAFASAVPALSEDLVIPTNAYPAIGDPDGDGSDGFDFTNGADGVYDLVEAGVDLTGTAFAVPLMPAGPGSPSALAGDGEPRRVDIFPIFYFGVPNLIPYQLVVGKDGGPLSTGKPFINNFLPVTQTGDGALWGGDMLRLNMAVPTTDRDMDLFQPFASKGLLSAAAIGLTQEPYNQSEILEFIPHMDGFPNGRRLEDDVTTIALNAVGSLVLTVVGLPDDDAVAGDYSDILSEQTAEELVYSAGPAFNDLPLREDFPYLANPHRGYNYVRDVTAERPRYELERILGVEAGASLGLGVPEAFLLEQSTPNPAGARASIGYHVARDAHVRLDVYDVRGRLVQTLVDEAREPGTHQAPWDASRLASGTYLYRLQVDGETVQTRQATVVR
ncbi:MAG: DUF4331 family protein [Rubricoccaceae bacterium]|nr:DUF4331 family protein [Rubricoccaceae bacterium]